ncbi:NCS2 family permease [[Acholeplasma] multilocale]|uniref:NCS2 family permease n=1 Tax=[Acholeplasma] multilocale TaxID=264638 RepID=UPI000686FD77|nr:NCS2 family permease [[Acholeplasma] multilocale]
MTKNTKSKTVKVSEDYLIEEYDFSNETPEQTAARFAKDFKFSKNKSIARLERYFKFDTLGAIWKKEFIGGLATFLSLIYILSVNPNILGSATSITEGAPNMNSFGIFLATAIASGVGSIAMGLMANIPVALSTTMGINAMFTFNLANAGNLGYEGALIAVMISSIMFFIVSVTPVRKVIMGAIPKQLILAFGIGIGFFIAVVGLTDMGWLKKDMDAGVPLASINDLQTFYPIILIGMVTLCIILVLHFNKIPGAVAIGIVCGFVIAMIFANTLSKDSSLYEELVGKSSSPLYNTNFRNGTVKWEYNFSGFTDNFKNTFKAFGNVELWKSPVMYISIFVFLFLDFFDTTGTMATFNHQLNKRTNQHHELSTKALAVDSATTMLGGVLGTSPVGVFVESSAGIEQGARTGVAAILNGVLFFAAIALFPIFKSIPSCVTSAACLYIGLMMIGEMKAIEWKKPEFAFATFFVIVFMMMTYSIADGIAMGVLIYTFVMLATKRYKQLPIAIWFLSVIFILYFVALAFIK